MMVSGIMLQLYLMELPNSFILMATWMFPALSLVQFQYQQTALKCESAAMPKVVMEDSLTEWWTRLKYSTEHFQLQRLPRYIMREALGSAKPAAMAFLRLRSSVMTGTQTAAIRARPTARLTQMPTAWAIVMRL